MIASQSNSEDFVARQQAVDLLSQIGVVVCGKLPCGRLRLYSSFHQRFSDIAKSRLNRCRFLQLCGPPAKKIANGGPTAKALKAAIELLSRDVRLLP
jgi:hypothetical protein